MLFLFCERVFDSFCLRVSAVSYILSKKKKDTARIRMQKSPRRVRYPTQVLHPK